MNVDEARSLLGQVYASEPAYCAARCSNNTDQIAHDDPIIVAWLGLLREGGVTEDLEMRQAVLGRMKTDTQAEIERITAASGDLDVALVSQEIRPADWQAQKENLDTDLARQQEWLSHLDMVIQGDPLWRP